MRRKRYSAKVKAAIVKAVKEVRSAGKSWKEALEAAKKAGYRGSLGGLDQMARKAGVKSQRPRSKGLVAKSSPGRPRKVAGAGSIEEMVNKVVREKLDRVLDEAIAILKEAKG